MTPDTDTNEELLLDVGDNHQLYIHDWGKADAQQPILYLHGGPGGGCHDGQKQNFDPNKQRVIFFDQRGGGRSLPTGELNHNTTDHLVSDLVKILDHFKLSSVVLFGRSWGSTLALTFAIRHPERVTAIVTGGILLGTRHELDLEDRGDRFRQFFPEAWQTLVSNTPATGKAKPIVYHVNHMLEAVPKEAKASAYAYSEFMHALMRLDDRRTPQDYEKFDPSGFIIESHYKTNWHFLEDNYILEHAATLAMPVYIVQGRYDIVCVPEVAYQLHQALPNSHLIWTIGNHVNSDRANYDATKAVLLQFGD
jgi:proline iminopeptidase